MEVRVILHVGPLLFVTGLAGFASALAGYAVGSNRTAVVGAAVGLASWVAMFLLMERPDDRERDDPT